MSVFQETLHTIKKKIYSFSNKHDMSNYLIKKYFKNKIIYPDKLINDIVSIKAANS